MISSPINPMAHRAWRSAAVAALASGLYVSIFHIAGNFTMLTPSSAFLVVAGLTLPIVLAVLVTIVVLSLTKRRDYTGFATAFICALYLCFALRAPIFESQVIGEFRNQLQGGSWLLAHLLYFLVPATLLAIIFGRHLGRLTAVLAIMTIAAILLGLRNVSSGSLTHRPQQAIVSAALDRKPNIYLLLADGFASFAYMDAKRIDVADFKGWLNRREFRLYEDTFSNYHATLDSMLSMLDMRHHYYLASQKLAEVDRSARQIIGGENDLIRMLKRNGYQAQYIHQGDYLLLQGCTVDYCFPHADKFAGARGIFRKVLPLFLVGRAKADSQPFSVVRDEVFTQIGKSEKSAVPRFQYIHLFQPLHTDNDIVGRCDEKTELEKYSRRVIAATGEIETIVGKIVEEDRDAVIVISGDHGPFISNRCGRDVDIGTPEEYRDRVGALTAIRWPSGYDNRFDGRIRTNVNVFRYVLASLIDNSTEALGGHVPDDVFVHGRDQVLKILDDGKFLIPPAKLSASELSELYVEDRSR